LNDVKSYNTIKDLLLYNNMLVSTIAKAHMLNKPYIHYIDVKIMNNVSRRCNWTDTIIRQQAVQLDCSYNDMFIKMLM
jgi:hypothetical protein